jgi:hypothetical protein
VARTVQWATMSFLILLCISSWIAYTRYKPKPPDLDFVINEQAVEVQPATYFLRKWGRAAAADTNSEPAALVKESAPIMIETGDSIKLIFEQSPDSVVCYLWDIDTGMLAYKGLDGYPLRLEQYNVASGDYALEIRARWENGYVLYNSRIIVHDDTQ